MKTLTLQRLEQNAFATYGHILDEENRFLCVTLERPWVDANHDGLSDPNVSCIPAGTYTAHRFHSPHFGYDLFKLSGIPGRDDVELHIGNLPVNSEGCILLGSNFGEVAGQHGITGSQAAFARFMDGLRGVDTWTLVVHDVAAVPAPDPAAAPAIAKEGLPV